MTNIDAPAEDDVAGLQAALDAEAGDTVDTGRSDPDSSGTDDAGIATEPIDEVASDAETVDVGDLAADYIEELLDICDLDGDIEIEDEGGRTTIKVTGGDLHLLSAPDTVGALQELARLAVQTRTGGFARLTLDIGGSRDQRSRQLATFVQRAADAFAAGDATYPLDPMSSYERKLVHDLASEQGMGSHSEGEGSTRHIVLTPA